MALLRKGSAIRREITAAQRIPYAAHVAPSVISTVFGDYIQVFRLGGASFETSDDDELNNWHERLNVLWRNIAGPNVAAVDARDPAPRSLSPLMHVRAAQCGSPICCLPTVSTRNIIIVWQTKP